jgi:hypothetical protein
MFFIFANDVLSMNEQIKKYMKKITITLIAVLTTIVSFAQTQVKTDSSVHLSFKGVSIDGKLSEYVLKMKQNGFTQTGTEDGVAILKGDFASYRGCTIGVATLKGKDLVSKITVIFPAQESWSLLSSNYFTLKELLTEKYGQPSESIEKFSSFEPDDDGSKLIQVHLDACKYVTTYETEKGSIQLSIKGDHSNAFVILSYFDKINGGIIRAKAKDDL